MTSPTQAAGSIWERRAAQLLSDHGLRVLERGYRCRQGELDLICRDEDQIVIVEVRSRSGRSHGGALASIDARKIRKIVLATRHYLMTHPQFGDAPVRFDVVAIEDRHAAEPDVHWIRNAFDGA